MIRLILVAIGILIIWVLFLSKFNKQKKIIICITSLLVCIVAVWFDQYSQTPKEGVMRVNELEDCGVSSNHSYRTNYDIEFCLRNLSLISTAKRVSISFTALNCAAGDCQEVQVIRKDVSLSLEPESQVTLQENLNFDQVERPANNVVWLARVDSVKAVK